MFPELEQKEQVASSDSTFITEEVAERVIKELALWKSQNSEPLGQLWLGLFKYVCICILNGIRDHKIFGSHQSCVQYVEF